jgi:hypothetical protein
MRDSERELDNIFLSYNKILKRLNSRGYKLLLDNFSSFIVSK